MKCLFCIFFTSTVEETLLSRPHATHGESSATTDPPSAMTDAPSTTTDETLAMTDETSQMTGETSPMTGETSAMTGETSAMTEASHEDIIARVEARTTDEVPAPHSWICRRPMLRLHNAHHEGNLMAFQSRWQKGEVSKDKVGYNVFSMGIKGIERRFL